MYATRSHGDEPMSTKLFCPHTHPMPVILPCPRDHCPYPHPFPLSLSPSPSYCPHAHQASPNLCSRIFATNRNIQGRQKSKPLTGLSINRIKTCQQIYFFVKVECRTATEVNANKHLLVLNILSIKWSMCDLKCDVNYCVYTLR